MSQWTVVALRCDRSEWAAPDERCRNMIAAVPGESLVDLRLRALREGWGREPVTNGRDWCPLHVTETEQSREGSPSPAEPPKSRNGSAPRPSPPRVPPGKDDAA